MGTTTRVKIIFIERKENEMEIRRFQIEDAEETAALIAKTLRETNSKDYTDDYLEATIASHDVKFLKELDQSSHFYVVCDHMKIIGCGAIAGYWGSTTESILLTIFVLPEYQGKGIGKQIIQTLEQDEYFFRAKRIEIPASVTAVKFYQKMGYAYKNGITEPDDEQLYRLEKYR